MSSATSRRQLDMVIVGAGFAGLYMLHKAHELGLRAEVIERGDGVGGTWYWNRYPGARCDVPSMEYSLGFDHQLEQEWEWTEKYATQAEILAYIEHVVDRFDLHADITLSTAVSAARFDESTNRWSITASDGVERSCRFVVMATGCLSAANVPDIEGRDTFAGRTVHTGRWPHEGVDFAGRRVAVIGTGSSAVQSIPLIAAEADHVTVFQRTATWAVPAHNDRWTRLRWPRSKPTMPVGDDALAIRPARSGGTSRGGTSAPSTPTRPNSQRSTTNGGRSVV